MPPRRDAGQGRGRELRASVCYFAAVFAAGFALGVPRTVLLEPAVGPLAAVLVELPLMLLIAWLVCGQVLRRCAVPPRVAVRLRVGGAALLLLLTAELLLSLLAGRTPAEFAAHHATPAGVAGLAGQLVFGLMPVLRR